MKLLVLKTGEPVLLDDTDYDSLRGEVIRARRGSRTNVYAHIEVKNGDGQYSTKLLHRYLLNPPEDMLVDHINGCGLDNRRENLRIVTPTENNRNRKIGRYWSGKQHKESRDHSTGFIGVSSTAKSGKFRAYISTGGREYPTQHWLGIYNSAEEAARQRDRAAVYFFGQQARLNFPDQSESVEPASPAQIRSEMRKRHGKNNGLKGVSQSAYGWLSTIRHNYHTYYLGVYSTDKDAALAFDSAALYFGRPRQELNFPELETQPVAPHHLVRPAEVRSESGYLGVCRKWRKFSARIMVNRKVHKLGVFNTAEEAAIAYDRTARFFKETRNLNFPDRQLEPCAPSGNW